MISIMIWFINTFQIIEIRCILSFRIVCIKFSMILITFFRLGDSLLCLRCRRLERWGEEYLDELFILLSLEYRRFTFGAEECLLLFAARERFGDELLLRLFFKWLGLWYGSGLIIVLRAIITSLSNHLQPTLYFRFWL